MVIPRFADITKNIENMQSIVDDTLLWSDNLQDNFSDKIQFGHELVDFASLEGIMTGVRPIRKFLDSIRAFPQPKTLSDARSFFGW